MFYNCCNNNGMGNEDREGDRQSPASEIIKFYG